MHKVLFVRHGMLGDCLLITPFLRTYRKHHPEPQIDVYSYVSIFQSYSCVNRWIDGRKVSLDKIKHNYDRIFYFNYEHEPQLHVLQGYQISSGLTYDSPQIELPDTKPGYWQSVTEKIGGYWFFQPVSGTYLRSLPKAKIQEFIDAVREAYPNLTPVVVHNKRLKVQNCVNLTGCRLTSLEIMEIIKSARFFVGVDSGLFHIAQGASVPAIFIAGPTELRLRVTNPGCVRQLSVYSLDCLGCYHRNIAPYGEVYDQCLRGDFACMQNLTAGQLVREINQLIGSTTRQRKKSLPLKQLAYRPTVAAAYHQQLMKHYMRRRIVHHAKQLIKKLLLPFVARWRKNCALREIQGYLRRKNRIEEITERFTRPSKS
jgi:ADP-heptose:LPS heptosyltransferase